MLRGCVCNRGYDGLSHLVLALALVLVLVRVRVRMLVRVRVRVQVRRDYGLLPAPGDSTAAITARPQSVAVTPWLAKQCDGLGTGQQRMLPLPPLAVYTIQQCILLIVAAVAKSGACQRVL